MQRRTIPIGLVVLLVLAGLLYALMLANLIDTEGTDAAGRGYDLAFGLLVGLILWVVLAMLLIRGRHGLSPAGRLEAVLLIPASAFAVFLAVNEAGRQNGWWLLAPVLLPPLIVVHALRPRTMVGMAILAVTVLFIAEPLLA